MQMSCGSATPAKVKIFVILGEIFGILGDVCIQIQFLLGGIFFVICHICYIIAFFPIREKQQNISYSRLIITAIIAVVGDICCLFKYIPFF
jgi:uncharacterized membrane protein YhhN